MGKKGRVGLEGQMEDDWQTMERTFMRTRTRLLLRCIFNKYFLSFSNVLDTVPGTRVTAISWNVTYNWKGRTDNNGGEK